MPALAFEQRFDPVPALSARFTALLRALDDEQQRARVVGLDWNAAEVGAHVLTVVRRYLSATERAATRARLSELNAEDIAELGLTVPQVADELDSTIAQLGRVAPTVPLDGVRDFHLGVRVSVSAGWANLIGELFVHGHDIATATGLGWSIDDGSLEGIWRALLPAAAGWMRHDARHVTELYVLHFSFGAVTVRLEQGCVLVDNPADAKRRPDHEIDIVDAAAFTLQFPYRRACIEQPVAALLASRFIDI